MKKESNSGISFFQRYLTVWVIICMLIGIMLGHFFGMKEALNYLEYAGISIPLAVLIWIMIYPMMMKVDFKSIKNIGKNPKGLFVTWIVNWLIKPFTMYGIASFSFLWCLRHESHRILRRSISQEPCFSEQLHVPLWYLSGVR